MKRFLLRFGLLLALVAGLDALCGFFFQGLTKSAIGGDTARNEYIANKVTAPILILVPAVPFTIMTQEYSKTALEWIVIIVVKTAWALSSFMADTR